MASPTIRRRTKAAARRRETFAAPGRAGFIRPRREADDGQVRAMTGPMLRKARRGPRIRGFG